MISTDIRRIVQQAFSRPSPRTDRDRSLAHRLHTTFEKNAPLEGVKNLHFYVVDGTVTVLGHIEDPRRKEFFLSVLQEIPGVKGVVDRVRTGDEVYTHRSSSSVANAPKVSLRH